MALNGPIPYIAVMAGGAVVVSAIILYQILIMDNGTGPDPFRRRSHSQDTYMRQVRTRNQQMLWGDTGGGGMEVMKDGD